MAMFLITLIYLITLRILLGAAVELTYYTLTGAHNELLVAWTLFKMGAKDPLAFTIKFLGGTIVAWFASRYPPALHGALYAYLQAEGWEYTSVLWALDGIVEATGVVCVVALAVGALLDLLFFTRDMFARATEEERERERERRNS